MTDVPIPVIWEDPIAADFEQFQTTLARQPDQKIFIPCTMTMQVSAFIALHQRLNGVPESIAAGDLVQIWEPNETWQRLIDASLARVGLIKVVSGWAIATQQAVLPGQIPVKQLHPITQQADCLNQRIQRSSSYTIQQTFECRPQWVSLA